MNVIQSKEQEGQEMLSEWVHQFSDELFAWAYYKTSHRSTAEDLVQDTFLAALRSLEKFGERSSPKTWLFSILNKKIIDHYRKKRRDALSADSAAKSGKGGGVLDYYFDEHGSWRKEHKPRDWEGEEVHLLDNPEFRHMLQGCLHKLPSNWSASLQLKYLDGKEGKDICQDLGISPSNYWQMLHRAKLQLRACLDHHWFKK